MKKTISLARRLSTLVPKGLHLLGRQLGCVNTMEAGMGRHQSVNVSFLSPHIGYTFPQNVQTHLTLTNTVIACPTLGDPENGTAHQEDNLPGTEAFYSCAEGFVLVGEASRFCQYNGTWDGQPPVCKRKDIIRDTVYNYSTDSNYLHSWNNSMVTVSTTAHSQREATLSTYLILLQKILNMETKVYS